MAPTQDTYNDFINNSRGKVYTLMEACDFMETLDTFPTGNVIIRWVNARTGAPVTIGCAGGHMKPTKKEKVKKPYQMIKYYDKRTGKPKFK